MTAENVEALALDAANARAGRWKQRHDNLRDEVHAAIVTMLDDHMGADDWKCRCGHDCFGGSAAYSFQLLKSHMASEAVALLKDGAS